MSKSTQIPISEGLHGFVDYQYLPDLLDDPHFDRFSLTHYAACGMFSVHHALVFLGQGDSLGNMKSLHPRFWDLIWNGLESDKLIEIAKRAGAKTDLIETWQLKLVKPWVDRHITSGHPVIIGSEPACHWICIGGKTSDGFYVWADSAASPAIGICSWEELEGWMASDEETDEDVELEYPIEAIAVLPGKRMPASRSIVPWIDGIWEVWANDPKYARNWSNLLADMLQVFWDAEYVKRGIPAGDFLDEHSSAIVDAVSSLNGRDKSLVRDHASAYRDAAHFHNLAVDPGQESATLARFTLMLQAAVAKVY
jgi:hypothetical protein